MNYDPFIQEATRSMQRDLSGRKAKRQLVALPVHAKLSPDSGVCPPESLDRDNIKRWTNGSDTSSIKKSHAPVHSVIHQNTGRIKYWDQVRSWIWPNFLHWHRVTIMPASRQFLLGPTKCILKDCRNILTISPTVWSLLCLFLVYALERVCKERSQDTFDQPMPIVPSSFVELCVRFAAPRRTQYYI